MTTSNLSFREQETQLIGKIRQTMEQISEWDKNRRNTDQLYLLLERNLKKYQSLRQAQLGSVSSKGALR